MSEGSKNAREQAEIAFGAIQTKELYRGRLAAEQDDVASERRAKTERLKAARLAAEAKAPPPVVKAKAATKAKVTAKAKVATKTKKPAK